MRFVVVDVPQFCKSSALSENSLTNGRLLFVFFFCPGAVVQGGITTYNGRILERCDLTANKRPGVISLWRTPQAQNGLASSNVRVVL